MADVDYGTPQGYVWNKTPYSRGVKATLADVAAIPSPVTGETVFCSENGKILTYDGELWMCDDFIKSINGTVATRTQGEPMVFQTSIGSTRQVILPTTTGDSRFAGVVVYSSAAGAPIALAYRGIYRAKITLFTNNWNSSQMDPIRTSSLNGGFETIANYIGTSAGHCGWLIQNPANGTTPQLCWCLFRGKVEYY